MKTNYSECSKVETEDKKEKIAHLFSFFYLILAHLFTIKFFLT